MMVDRACGVTAEDLSRPAPKTRDVDADTKALMDVGTAAVAWLKLRDTGTLARRVKAETALADAAMVLAATGW
jgi:hypothetical protein